MSSIPLPALGVQAPQSDPIGQYSKLVALKSLLQNQQYEQQARPLELQQQQAQTQQAQIGLHDQQAMTKSLQEWDGKDINSLPGILIKNGGSAQSVLGFKQKILEQAKAASDIAKNDAETGSKNLDSQLKKNDMIAGGIQSVLDAPDHELAQRLIEESQGQVEQGILDPQRAQQAAQVAQSGNPAQIREWLKVHQKLAMGYTAQLKAAQDQAGTREQNAAASQKELENSAMQQYGGLNNNMADGKYRFLQQKLAGGQPISPDDKAFMKGYEKQKLLVPATVANIRVEGMGNLREYPVYDQKSGSVVMATPMEINRAKTEEPGRYTAAGYTPEAEIQKKTGQTFGPGGKGSEEILAFNTALAHADILRKATQAMNNGDVQALNSLKNSWQTQFGSPLPTNAKEIANVYSREVTKAVSAGHITDAEIKDQGATLDTSKFSPAQIAGALSNYEALMQSKKNLRMQQFEAGKKGQVFSGNQAQQPSQSAPTPSATGPNGHKIVVENGRWVDAQTHQPI